MPAQEKTVPIQDQARESQVITLFGLTPNPDRLGPDAFDEMGNPYELKSTTVSGVGTGRDVSLKMIKRWLTRYWLISRGKNFKSGFQIEQVYFLHPDDIAGRLLEIGAQIAPDLKLRNTVLEKLKDEISKEALGRVKYLMSRGATLNNPKISWKYIVTNGTLIDQDHQRRLKKLVKARPIIS